MDEGVAEKYEEGKDEDKMGKRKGGWGRHSSPVLWFAKNHNCYIPMRDVLANLD